MHRIVLSSLFRFVSSIDSDALVGCHVSQNAWLALIRLEDNSVNIVLDLRCDLFHMDKAI